MKVRVKVKVTELRRVARIANRGRSSGTFISRATAGLSLSDRHVTLKSRLTMQESFASVHVPNLDMCCSYDMKSTIIHALKQEADCSMQMYQTGRGTCDGANRYR